MGGVNLGRWVIRGAGCIALGLIATAVSPGCSLGQGQGSVTGTLNIPLCWSGSFNLDPTFFAAVPYNSAGTDAAANAPGAVSSLEIRIQHGTTYESFSDGIFILVDNVHAIRGDPPYPSEIGKPLRLALSPEIVAPGVPIPAVADPATVSLNLYLNASCATEEIALYALDEVSLNANGSCDQPQDGPVTIECPTDTGLADAGATAPVSEAGADANSGNDGAAPIPKTASSTITFQSLFDGNPSEANATQRLTQATFDAYLGDPREGCPGGTGPPPPCRGHITGTFSFYFERGQPAQPFQLSP
jgi:hypothetical protein